MADIIAQQEQVKRPPNWQAQLAQLVGAGQNPTYGSEFAGQDTLGTKKMKSQEKMHAAEISQKDRAMSMQYKMHAESLALQRWSEEQRWALSWAEFDETKRVNSYNMRDDDIGAGGVNPILDQVFGKRTNSSPSAMYSWDSPDMNVLGAGGSGATRPSTVTTSQSTQSAPTSGGSNIAHNPTTVRLGKFGVPSYGSTEAQGTGGWGIDLNNPFAIQPQTGRNR